MIIKQFAMCAALAGVCWASAGSASIGTSAWAISGSSNNYGGYWDASSQGSRILNPTPLSSATASYSVGGLAGSATASADLATGKLRASAVASTQPFAGLNESRGEAYWTDEIAFHATGTGVTTIKLLYHFHGVQTGGTPDLYYASTELLLGGAGFSLGRLKNGGFSNDEFRQGYANWSSYKLTGGGDSYDVETTFTFEGPLARYNISASLVTIASGNATSNFANTSTLRFVLPDNVTMSSQSGVFLSAAAAVPEPGSWALAIAGFGAIGGASRQRRKLVIRA